VVVAVVLLLRPMEVPEVLEVEVPEVVEELQGLQAQ
jgi:hypothetical protein